jgi:multimeric flavodoxin WrbA
VRRVTAASIEASAVPTRSQTTPAGDRRFLFLHCGSRADGNTEILARHAAAALPAGVEQRWLSLSQLPLPAFEDVRHVGDGVYPVPEGHAHTLLEATLWASDLVFAAPLYWYSLPAPAKLYLDHWSGWMRAPGVEFRARMAGKVMWAVSAISDEDRAMADPLLDTLRLTAAYMQMTWGGSLLGFGNRPGDVLTDTTALADAARLFGQLS